MPNAKYNQNDKEEQHVQEIEQSEKDKKEPEFSSTENAKKEEEVSKRKVIGTAVMPVANKGFLNDPKKKKMAESLGVVSKEGEKKSMRNFLQGFFPKANLADNDLFL